MVKIAKLFGNKVTILQFNLLAFGMNLAVQRWEVAVHMRSQCAITALGALLCARGVHIRSQFLISHKTNHTKFKSWL